MQKSHKIIFLDRDGTLNELDSDTSQYISKISKFRFIPGTIEALQLFQQQGHKLYIVTNQSGIARGYYSLEDFKKLNTHMLALFQQHAISIEEVLYCPHHVRGVIPEYSFDCDCRKPKPGMLERVLKANNYQPQDCLMIGDKEKDIQAGQSLGIRSYLVETGHGLECSSNTQADGVFPNLLAIAQSLL